MNKTNEKLASLPIFAGLSKAELDLFSERFVQENFPAGTQIIKQGYGGLKIYVLMEGRVEVYKTIDGDKVKITSLEPTEAFGELGVVDGEPASASIDAELDCLTLSLGRDDFYDILQSSRELEAKIWRNLLVALCERLRTTTNQVQDYFGINKALCDNETFRSFYKLFYS